MTTKKTPKKTDALTLRLDPRAKFLIELTARLGHQTITGVIESAVKMQAHHRTVALAGNDTTLVVAADYLWAPEESERVVSMVLFAPGLLNHEELCIKSVLDGASHIFFNLRDVPNEKSAEYRNHYFQHLTGAFQQDEFGELMFITPKKRTIKLAWGLIKMRAAELAEKGSYNDLTAAEVEAYIGRSLDSVSPLIKAPRGEIEDGEEISVSGSDKERDDLLSSLGHRG